MNIGITASPASHFYASLGRRGIDFCAPDIKKLTEVFRPVLLIGRAKALPESVAVFIRLISRARIGA